MKVQVDSSICAGFSACLGACPRMFELHADGYAIVRSEAVPKEFEAAVREAASQCPTGAITVSQDSQ